MPWAKGVSGNPGGRPKDEESVTAYLRKIAKELKEGNTTKAEALARSMWDKALEEGGRHAEYLVDRLDGKPRERVEVKDISSNPIYEMLNKITQQNEDAEPEADKLHSEQQS